MLIVCTSSWPAPCQRAEVALTHLTSVSVLWLAWGLIDIKQLLHNVRVLQTLAHHQQHSSHTTDLQNSSDVEGAVQLANDMILSETKTGMSS